MYGKKVKLRLTFLIVLILSLGLTIYLVLVSLKENVVYFLSPTEIKALSELKKDRYFLSNNGNFLYGEKTGTKYMMSQKLNVIIIGTSPLEGKINLKLDN